MAAFEVPLSPTPQRFSIELGGTTYNMRLQWSDAAEGGWVLDIFDTNDVPIVGGIPLVTGSNLLAQYAYLGFTGALMVQTDYDLNAVPTFENLGIQSHLYFITTDA